MAVVVVVVFVVVVVVCALNKKPATGKGVYDLLIKIVILQEFKILLLTFEWESPLGHESCNKKC